MKFFSFNRLYLKQFFQENGPVDNLGEKSTSYIEHPEAGRRIKTFFPDAKIIFILRNPVFRAVSNFFYSKQNGLESREMETAFFENEKQHNYSKSKFSVNPFDYLNRGFYFAFLSEYFEIFKKSQVKIVIHEEIIGQQAEVSELYEFLNIDRNFVPESLNRKINDTNKKTKVPHSVLTKLNDIYLESIVELEEFLERNLTVWKIEFAK